MTYPFRSIEAKWQRTWTENNTDKTPQKPSKSYYVLEMLPYPSGRIHMGHVRNYTLGDALARFKRAQGYDVVHPMGWDAFGLPAENAAIERQIPPGKWTYANINDMREQLKPFGFSYDWELEFATCDPTYYGHEQEMFITFFEKGLMERRKSLVNWDPIDQCVLANEQVVDGKGWRSGATVERRPLSQWFFSITSYVDELQKCIDDGQLNDWPQKVTKMQTNWIGKREGVLVELRTSSGEPVTLFVTDLEQLDTVHAILLPLEHPLVAASNKDEVKALVKQSLTTPLKEEVMATQTKQWCSLGITLEGGIPLGVGNWVVEEPVILTEPGMGWNTAYKAQIHNTQPHTTWRLRDWLVSRQRYWGCPIPMVYCATCGIVPVPRDQLPLTLPDDVDVTGKGNPLDSHPTWRHTNCPKCDGKAHRDTDTLDTFFESSWYFLRYLSPKCDNRAFEKSAIQQWMPVDTYIGGIEHAVMHLLYARFFHKALIDCGYIPSDVPREPFKRLITQGMVCHCTYQREDGTWMYPGEVEEQGGHLVCKQTKQSVKVGRSEKMSKSKRNTIEPEPMLAAYGADAVRFFVLSDTPPDKDLDWSEEALEGSWRYMNRLWRLKDTPQNNDGDDDQLLKLAHRLLKRMTLAYEQLHYNKVIAWHRELVNAFEDKAPKSRGVQDVWRIIVQTLAPIAPHIAHELWDGNTPVAAVPWPIVDESLAYEDEVVLAVQVNGKLRGTITVSPDAEESTIVEQALALNTVQTVLDGASPRRIVVVPGRIVNVVM